MKQWVLICSHDPELYLILSHILGLHGIRSELASGVDEVLALVAKEAPQAVVLDCQPASKSGPTICARIKREPRSSGLPVIALVALGAQNQLVDLLKAGIDETFVRPLVPAKLLDYLHAALGQPNASLVENGRSLFSGNLQMELVAHRVRRNGQDVHLGLIEFNLLRHLLENPGKVFSREELISAAWPDNIHVCARTVDVHISRLRKTLKTVSCSSLIRTVRSLGYSLEELDG
ncbi:Phosphate regulon transcriptional regulatory protein PhoB [Ensifer psoraleae]|uniref:response regulator transcription factor n=1 Tax=Sinorhizobium psoraleae TaxID=520838 RepID=UPI001569F433|nr:response regulator transcription factor [Sinorhizobium psoraleae]NRP75246.1 Phosphate regulon transcriptional regulatory protein PhoB [Sinorhizobium psoraleae]